MQKQRQIWNWWQTAVCCSEELASWQSPVGVKGKVFPADKRECCLFDSHWPKSSDGWTEGDFYWTLARWTSVIL